MFAAGIYDFKKAHDEIKLARHPRKHGKRGWLVGQGRQRAARMTSRWRSSLSRTDLAWEKDRSFSKLQASLLRDRLKATKKN